jgi:hypothetical protein
MTNPRMTLLITVFLVLVNIFNTITTNIPKAEGLTAIEAWVIVCVLFVFGALVGETTLNIFHIKLYFVIYFFQFFRVCWDFVAHESEGFKKGEETPATQQSRELR